MIYFIQGWFWSKNGESRNLRNKGNNYIIYPLKLDHQLLKWWSIWLLLWGTEQTTGFVAPFLSQWISLGYAKCFFPGGLDCKASAYNAGDLSSIRGLGRSPGEGNDNPHQYSCLENPRDRRSLVGYSPWGRKESDTAEWVEKAHVEQQRPSTKFLHCCPANKFFGTIFLESVYMH